MPGFIAAGGHMVEELGVEDAGDHAALAHERRPAGRTGLVHLLSRRLGARLPMGHRRVRLKVSLPEA